MRRYGILLLLAMLDVHAASVEQRTEGWCSPAVADVKGNVQVVCNGVDPRALARLNELLDLKDLQIQDKLREADDWARKYRELEQQLSAESTDSELAAKAKALLDAGQLEEAGTMLDRLLDKGELEIERIASHQYSRAQVYGLQFEPTKALPHYAKAYQYRPENPEYGHAYATALLEQKQYAAAEPIFLKALTIYRALAEANPAAYRPDVAMTLNNLANLYRDTQRLGEAEQAYREALTIRRALAETNPAAYRPDVATTLNNLAVLYSDTQRLGEALAAAQEAVELYRALAAQRPDAFTPDLATSLGALGSILRQDERTIADAAACFAEGIERLTPLFLRLPMAYAQLIGALARDYLTTCQQAGIEPDADLLGPVAEVFQRLNEAGAEER